MNLRLWALLTYLMVSYLFAKFKRIYFLLMYLELKQHISTKQIIAIRSNYPNKNGLKPQSCQIRSGNLDFYRCGIAKVI